jgi:glutathione S-transferase
MVVLVPFVATMDIWYLLTLRGCSLYEESMITLFGTVESGNDHKVQLILRRTGVTYHRVQVSQVRGEPRHPDYLRINPIGKVPAILFETGDVISESGALLYWFGRNTCLWPTDERIRTEVLRWMFFEQYSHEPTLAVLRYYRKFASKSQLSTQQIRELGTKAHNALTTMETNLESRPWIAGNACSLADIALYPYTKWANEAGISIEQYPAIVRWLEAMESEPQFIPLGTDGAASTISFADFIRQKTESLVLTTRQRHLSPPCTKLVLLIDQTQ